MARKVRKPRDCACGCGGITAGGEFLPGHDAKLLSNLTALALNGDKAALGEIAQRNWTHLYDQRAVARDLRAKRKANRVAKPAGNGLQPGTRVT
jgi:hypothetical protein